MIRRKIKLSKKRVNSFNRIDRKKERDKMMSIEMNESFVTMFVVSCWEVRLVYGLDY